jgi:hypothetical protein
MTLHTGIQATLATFKVPVNIYRKNLRYLGKLSYTITFRQKIWVLTKDVFFINDTAVNSKPYRYSKKALTRVEA